MTDQNRCAFWRGLPNDHLRIPKPTGIRARARLICVTGCSRSYA